MNSCFKYILKQLDNIAQKDDFNLFIPATTAIFSGANPALVGRRWTAKDIQGLSCQSEHAFNAIHCSSIYYYEVTYLHLLNNLLRISASISFDFSARFFVYWHCMKVGARAMSIGDLAKARLFLRWFKDAGNHWSFAIRHNFIRTLTMLIFSSAVDALSIWCIF